MYDRSRATALSALSSVFDRHGWGALPPDSQRVVSAAAPAVALPVPWPMPRIVAEQADSVAIVYLDAIVGAIRDESSGGFHINFGHPGVLPLAASLFASSSWNWSRWIAATLLTTPARREWEQIADSLGKGAAWAAEQGLFYTIHGSIHMHNLAVEWPDASMREDMLEVAAATGMNSCLKHGLALILPDGRARSTEHTTDVLEHVFAAPDAPQEQWAQPFAMLQALGYPQSRGGVRQPGLERLRAGLLEHSLATGAIGLDEALLGFEMIKLGCVGAKSDEIDRLQREGWLGATLAAVGARVRGASREEIQSWVATQAAGGVPEETSIATLRFLSGQGPR